MHSPDEVELVAHIANAGDTSCEINGPPLHLLIVRMHIPESGNGKLPGSIEDLRTRRNAHAAAWPYRSDYAVLDQDHAILYWWCASGIFKRSSSNGEHLRGRDTRAGRKPCELCKVRFDSRGDECSEIIFVGFANRLKVVELGICADQRDKVLCVVEPKRFLAPDQAANSVAVRSMPIDGQCACGLDVHFGCRGIDGKFSRLSVQQPPAQHLLLHGDWRVTVGDEPRICCSNSSGLAAPRDGDAFVFHRQSV